MRPIRGQRVLGKFKLFQNYPKNTWKVLSEDLEALPRRLLGKALTRGLESPF